MKALSAIRLCTLRLAFCPMARKRFSASGSSKPKGRHRRTIEADLRAVLGVLASDEALEARHQDHMLTGNWRDHRDCHLKPDLVLIYSKPEGVLRLVRL